MWEIKQVFCYHSVIEHHMGCPGQYYKLKKSKYETHKFKKKSQNSCYLHRISNTILDCILSNRSFSKFVEYKINILKSLEFL